MSSELEDKVLDEKTASQAVAQLKGWEREDKAIKKTFTLNSFVDAIAFVNRVAAVAEALNHHPDFDINYKRVTLRNWTHKHDALTEADIKLAEDIDKVA